MASKKTVEVGGLEFGGGRIFIQSMLNVPPEDIDGNIMQAVELEQAGCDVIRVAVPNIKDVNLIPALKQAVNCPIVADIHYDYKIAVEAVSAGADKIRINPGNIGDDSRVKSVVQACKNANIPIRVGVNSGSVSREPRRVSVFPQYSENHNAIKKNISQQKVCAIVQSAMENIRLLEKFDFEDIVVSVKSSSVTETISAYRELAELVPYPLHLGVTEAGTERMGLIKSAIGIGSLLCDGIGDTIRVSLTAPPVKEVKAAIDILKSVGRYVGEHKGVEIISCPTCGRCKIDVIALAKKVEELLSGDVNASGLVIGVMGCSVNGPGECKHADFGITGGDGAGLIFRRGEIVRKVEEEQLLTALLEEIRNV